jgi:hypothetical protein
VNQSAVSSKQQNFRFRPRRSKTADRLLYFLMDRVVTARAAKFLQLQPVLVLLLVLRRSVVAVFAVAAL